MRQILAFVTVGALFISGCSSTQTAMEDDHKVIVKITEHSFEDLEANKGDHVKIVIKRDNGDLFVLEGDPSDPEIQAELKKL